MRFGLAALALLVTAAPAGAEVTSCARVEADGARTLCHEAVVPAPVADVWALWSTTEGLSSWVAPVAAIDLRIGGLWEASYNPASKIGDPGNIQNRILSFVPGRMISIQVAQTPPGFAHVDHVKRLWTVIELEPEGRARTRVRVTMLGYRAGPEFDALHADFDRGNAFTLRTLERRIATGPVDWRAIRAPSDRAGAAKGRTP